jgi:hypothetical protein
MSDTQSVKAVAKYIMSHKIRRVLDQIRVVHIKKH